MAATIKENASIILTALFEESKILGQNNVIAGHRIQELTELDPDQMNHSLG